MDLAHPKPLFNFAVQKHACRLDEAAARLHAVHTTHRPALRPSRSKSRSGDQVCHAARHRWLLLWRTAVPDTVKSRPLYGGRVTAISCTSRLHLPVSCTSPLEALGPCPSSNTCKCAQSQLTFAQFNRCAPCGKPGLTPLLQMAMHCQTHSSIAYGTTALQTNRCSNAALSKNQHGLSARQRGVLPPLLCPLAHAHTARLSQASSIPSWGCC